MQPKIYIETSIPSFYFEIRTEPEMIARKKWTVQWWDEFAGGYTLVTSVAVLEELARGNHPSRNDALELLKHLRLLPIQQEIREIVEAYVRHQVMPKDPFGDALHLAVASFHKCEFLLTWNCKHLANANKFGHIRRVNTMLGLYVPSLVTPLEFLGGENDAN
jgi:predicted nucleic acid-binding protein